MEVGPHGGLYLEILGKPKPANSFSKTSHWALTHETKTWREAAEAAAKAHRLPALTPPVAIYIHHFSSAPRRKLDPGCVYWAQKAAVDGLVDAGVLSDDSDQFVAMVAFLPVVRGPKDALGLELVEAADRPDTADWIVIGSQE